MKPTTKTQKCIEVIAPKLGVITPNQINWAYKKCFVPNGIISRGKTICLECNTKFKADNQTWHTELVAPSCPTCNKELKIISTNQLTDCDYFSVVTTCNNFQVVRIVFIQKTMTKNAPPIYVAKEVIQHWIGESGNISSKSASVMGTSYYYDKWILSSEMTFKPSNFTRNMKFLINPTLCYPKQKTLLKIKQNGYVSTWNYDIPYHIFFSMLLTEPIFETLVKRNDEQLIRYYYNNPTKIKKCWNTLKICFRNNYKFDASIYFDYLDDLAFFNKDLKNAHFVCPNDLESSHNKFTQKRTSHLAKLELKEMEAKIKENNEIYKVEKAKYLNFCIEENDFSIKTIQSVQDFYLIGKLLNHCVFTNKYYQKENSIVLEVRYKGEIVEATEVSTQNFSISQSRGFKNKATEHNAKIIELVQNSIPQLMKISNAS